MGEFYHQNKSGLVLIRGLLIWRMLFRKVYVLPLKGPMFQGLATRGTQHFPVSLLPADVVGWVECQFCVGGKVCRNIFEKTK